MKIKKCCLNNEESKLCHCKKYNKINKKLTIGKKNKIKFKFNIAIDLNSSESSEDDDNDKDCVDIPFVLIISDPEVVEPKHDPEVVEPKHDPEVSRT